MDEKYIVRACPSIVNVRAVSNWCLKRNTLCKDCMDCAIKKVINLNKKEDVLKFLDVLEVK